MVSDDPPTDRAALVNRQLPEMTLSNGNPLSNTAPPPPPHANVSPAETARNRFCVKGNAVST
jgi:hypothetical protein